jgi:hypothetical protein
MGGVSDNSLIKIADLDVNASFGIGEWSKVAEMAVSANPYGWPRRHLSPSGLQPLIEFHGASAHIGVCVARHL